MTQLSPLANVRDLTPTQSSLIALLSDELAHTSHELLRCLRDPMADSKCLKAHLYLLRLKIRKQGYGIRSERVLSTWYYRLVPIASLLRPE